MSQSTALCRAIHDDPRRESWTAELTEHAHLCPHCRRFLAGVQALTERLKELPRHTAAMPASLRATLENRLEASSAAPVADRSVRPPRRNLFRSWGQVLVPVAMAASLVLGVALDRQGIFRTPQTSGQVARTLGDYIHDVTHDHYLFAQLDNSLEVRMTDPAELSGWLRGTLHFAPELPASTTGFTLEGGRVWHTVNRLSALAAYGTPGGDEAILFAVPAEGLSPANADYRLVRGRRVYHGEGWKREAMVWLDGDLAMALVAPEGRLPGNWAEVFLP